MSYCLTRIALHDSYVNFRGKTSVLPTDGHFNINGDNGTGKTTALSLIPVFYGAEPNQCVEQVAGKLNFVDLYLPRQSSAVIYEHRREDGYRVVVLYRSRNGGRVIYRCAHGTLEENIFSPTILPLLQQGATISDVFSALVTQRIECSRQIDNTTDYRAIIQNHTRLMRSAGQRRTPQFQQMAREYCIGNSTSHCQHLERMTHAILKREDMFDRLKRMIAETQFSEIHINQRPAHMDDKTLVDDIASLHRFDTVIPLIHNCVSSHQQYEEAQETLRTTWPQLSALVKQGRAVESTRILAEDQAKDALETLRKTYLADKEQIAQAIAEARGDYQQNQKEIDHIRRTKGEWDDKRIHEKQVDYQRLHEFSAQLQQDKASLAMLTNQIQNLELEHQKAQQSAERHYSHQMTELNAHEQAARGQQTQLAQTLQQQIDQLHHARDEKKQQLASHPLNAQLEALQTAFNTAHAAAQFRYTSEAEQQQIDDLGTQTQEATETWEAAGRAAQQLVDKQHAERTQREDLNRDLNALAKQKHTLSTERTRLGDLLCPRDGTLLAQLREQTPDWSETIGRVIAPGLLSRTDLLPDFNPDAPPNTVFGWTLAFAKIDLPEHAESEAVLQAKIEQVESRIRNNVEEQGRLTERMAEHAKAIKLLDTEIAKAGAYTAQCQISANALRTRWSEAKQDAQTASIERQRDSQAEAQRLQTEINTLRATLSAMLTDIDREHEAQRAQLIADNKAEAERVATQIEQYQAQRVCATEAHEEELALIEYRFGEQCAAAGVSPEQIQAATLKVQRQKERIDTVQGYASELQDYQHWKANYWDTLPERESECATSKAIWDAASQKQTARSALYGRQRDEQAGVLRQCETQRIRITQANEHAQQALSTLHTLCEALAPAAEDIEGFTATPVHADALEDHLHLMAENAQGLIAIRNEMRQAVIAAVTEAQQSLLHYAHSRIARAWSVRKDQRRQSSTHSEHSDEFRLQLPPDLARLVEDDLPAIRDALIEQVRVVGDSLAKYHGGLKLLNDEVSRVTRHLKEHINHGQRIEDIANIELHVTSKVVEGDYWERLVAFISLWRDWQESRDEQLPPAALLDAIQSANQALRGARIETDINSLIRLKISVEEKGNRRIATNSREMNGLSSNGLSYLVLLVIFTGISRYLCPNPKIALHWPIDELAAISATNISLFFSMMDEAGHYCFTAFPDTNPTVLQFFDHKVLFEKSGGVREFRVGEAHQNSEDYQRLRAAVLAQATEEVE